MQSTIAKKINQFKLTVTFHIIPETENIGFVPRTLQMIIENHYRQKNNDSI